MEQLAARRTKGLSPERAIAPKGHRLREPHVTRSERSRGRKNGCSEAFGVGAAAGIYTLHCCRIVMQ